MSTCLLHPTELLGQRLRNRIIIAASEDDLDIGGLPLTGTLPNYSKAAVAGLLISPPLATDSCKPRLHTEAWRSVTEAVHEVGGRIVAQLDLQDHDKVEAVHEAATRILDAGFDGVELRIAAVPNASARQLQAVCEVWGCRRLGLRLQGVAAAWPLAQLTPAYLRLDLDVSWRHGEQLRMIAPLVLQEDTSPDDAELLLRAGRADLIAFPLSLTSHPTLVSRLANGLPDRRHTAGRGVSAATGLVAQGQLHF